MSDELSDELVDAGSTSNGGVPQVVKTLSILSIVGNSVWALIMLIFTLWFLGASSSLGRMMPVGMGEMMGIVIIILLLMLALNVVGLIAAIKLGKGQKSSFILYAIVTGIWGLLMLLSGFQGSILALLCAVSSIGFIVAFGMQLKNMPD
jgi:hypothetical protein